MSYEDSSMHKLPNETPEQEIWQQLTYSEQELINCEFISAYNRLKKAQKLIRSLPNSADCEEIIYTYRKLNNELNVKILKYISDLKTRR